VLVALLKVGVDGEKMDDCRRGRLRMENSHHVDEMRGRQLHPSDGKFSMVPYPPLLFHVMVVRDKHTSCAVSRLLSVGLSNVPIMNFPSTVVLHPSGAAASGATPSGGPCARLVAARQKSGARIDVRIFPNNVLCIPETYRPTRTRNRIKDVGGGGGIILEDKKVPTNVRTDNTQAKRRG
jgi:hypothetical protein